MKTSTTQFETMIEFMERHGDLNKPAVGPEGRLRIKQQWETLTNILNLDVTGDSKDKERWKKEKSNITHLYLFLLIESDIVWSDYKTNVKKKAAKIHQSATGTGGGPVCRLILSDLEHRVLQLIGTQTATGLNDIREVGIQMSHTSTSEGPPVPSSTLDDSTHCTSLQSASGSSHIQMLELLIPDLTPPIAAPRADSPGPVRQPTPTPRPTIESPPAATRRRRLFRRGSVSRQRRPTPLLDTPRRRRVSGPLRLEEASAQLEYFDQRWHILTQQIATEHMRLRERELDERQAEREQRREEMSNWQNIALELIRQRERERQAEREERRSEAAQLQTIVAQLIDVLKKYINK